MTNAPASPKQISFIRSLLQQIPADQTGINDVPAAMVQLENTLTGGKSGTASAMIEALLGMKNAVATTAGVSSAPAAKRSNGYPGKCQTCKGAVPAGAGWIQKSSTGKWLTFHHEGECPVADPATVAAATMDLPNGLYTLADGSATWKLYTTQNGRQACKALSGRTFHYVQGGTTLVKRGVADGTIHAMTQDEASAFGRLHGFCVNCGRDIDDDRSLAAGYGPVCAERFGWWYPTYEEAADVLGRPVTRPSGKVVVPSYTTGSDGAPMFDVVGATTVDAILSETCAECGANLVDTVGEPCLMSTPDYRGQYPMHHV